MAPGDENYPPEFWRAKANDARAMVENMVSDEGKRWMSEIARLDDRLLRRASKRKGCCCSSS